MPPCSVVLVVRPGMSGGFARLLGKAPGAVLTRYARRTGFIDEVGVSLPVVEDMADELKVLLHGSF